MNDKTKYVAVDPIQNFSVLGVNERGALPSILLVKTELLSAHDRCHEKLVWPNHCIIGEKLMTSEDE